MKYRVVIEIDGPEPDTTTEDGFDSFDAASWGNALLETTFQKMGGPKGHPYKPRVVEAYECPGRRTPVPPPPVTAADIVKVRNASGASASASRAALERASGDINAAIEILKKTGQA